MLLKDKIAIVTGAGRGIGSDIARLFASEGATVVVNYHSSAKDAEALAAEIGRGAIAVKADLTDANDVDALVETVIAHFGRVDILVNNAASFERDVLFEDSTWDAYLAELNGVLGATFHPTKAVLPHMKAQGAGRIVNFVATLVNRPAAGFSAHTTAKGAVLAFTRSVSREVGQFGITVNAVSPGMTMTNYSNKSDESVKKSIASQTSLRRLAQPLDVARVVLFYVSDLADFVTGANIAPDGGLAVIG